MAMHEPEAGGLSPRQISTLNKVLRDMKENRQPQEAAANLARCMRRYKITGWKGVSLHEADTLANTLLYCSQVYSGSRQWQEPTPGPTANCGTNMLLLYTASMERALVLRAEATPTWPSMKSSTGILYMPRHPEASAWAMLQVHRHRLPTTLRTWNVAAYSWENCCDRELIDNKLEKNICKMATGAPIESIIAAMVETWQIVHGPAKLAWATEQ